MTTPHAKTAEEVAKMVTFIPSSISGIASIVIGPHNEAIQGYELRPITAGDTFAEKAAKEIQEWFAAAIRDARTDGGKELASALSDMGVEICWAEPCHPTRAHVKVKSGHLLDDAGNVRRVLEWSHNPLTNRIHAEIDVTQGEKP